MTMSDDDTYCTPTLTVQQARALALLARIRLENHQNNDYNIVYSGAIEALNKAVAHPHVKAK